MIKIFDNLLDGSDISFVSSPNNGGKFSIGNPDTIVLHYTAGPSTESAINTFINPTNQVSAHLVIDLDGKITQLVPFDEIAWHAGKSSYKGRSGFNKYSIGIEIVNPGLLTKVGNQYQAWFGTKYNEDQVIQAVHRNESTQRYWGIYSEGQINAVLQVCKLLTEGYNIKYILGHEEISPGRKLDPGPAFPLNKIRDRILNNRKEEIDDLIGSNGKVKASKLNIRNNPDQNADKIAKAIPEGKNVQILAVSNGWYKVKTEITGWVSGKYIEIED